MFTQTTQGQLAEWTRTDAAKKVEDAQTIVGLLRIEPGVYRGCPLGKMMAGKYGSASAALTEIDRLARASKSPKSDPVLIASQILAIPIELAQKINRVRLSREMTTDEIIQRLAAGKF